MVEHQSAESEVLRFDSSRGLRMFSLSHTRDKVKNIFLYFDNCITLRWVQLFNGSPEFIRRVGTLSLGISWWYLLLHFLIRLVTLLLCHLYADQSSSQLVLRALLSKPSLMVSLLQFLSPVRIHSLFSDAYVESVDSNLQLKSAQRCFEESGGW